MTTWKKTNAGWSRHGVSFGKNPVDPIMWSLGEWFCSFDDLPARERKPSRRAIMTAADWQGPDYDTARIAAQTYRHFPPGERCLSVGYNKHQLAKSLPTGAALLLLERAGREKWTDSELEQEIRKWRSPWELATGDDIMVSMDGLIRDQRTFGQILADPPWHFRDEWNPNVAEQAHFETLSTDAICDIPVPKLAADNCFLHLWCPAALAMYDGRAVFDAWGFRCVGQIAWRKPRMGRGRYWRNQHETCYLGVKGQVPAFAESISSVFDAPCGKFGSKPEVIYSMIEKLAPGPLLELFGTHTRPGWTAVGNHIASGSAGLAAAAD
jgi:N6-adenosine-specific RNA methylase IME4